MNQELKVSDRILDIADKNNEKFLRQKTLPFDFNTFSLATIKNVINKMRTIMKKANGIGLSANQVGIPYRFFVAEVPDESGYAKFYAVFNPIITKFSKEEEETEEGCLSVPSLFGNVKRAYKIVLEGQNYKGKKIKIKAWGLLARVFQHEVDHLDGILFLDKTQDVHKIN